MYLHRQINRARITSRQQTGPISMLKFVVISIKEVLNNQHSRSSLINRKSNKNRRNRSVKKMKEEQ
jgi:hypothetical protein